MTNKTAIEQMVEWLEKPSNKQEFISWSEVMWKARSLSLAPIQEKEEGLVKITKVGGSGYGGMPDVLYFKDAGGNKYSASELYAMPRHPSKATEDRATGGFVEFVPDCSDEFERWVKTHFFGIGEKQIIKAYRKLHPVPSKATEGMALASFCHTCKTCAVREGFPCNNPIKPGNPPLADKLVEAIEEYFDYLRDTKGELHPKAKEILAKFKEAK